ncbi:hypothetical protein JZ751_029568, partial [Albula glossodonta]
STGVSQGKHAPLHEPVYEEIEYKLATEGTYSTSQRGSVLSEDPPSGYEKVWDSEGHSLSGKGVELCGALSGWELGDAAQNYDDVISADQNPGSAEGELLKGDSPEQYDDVITEEQSPGESVLAPEGPPAPKGMDYDD